MTNHFASSHHSESTAYIGIGSNIGNRLTFIKQALDEMSKLSNTSISAISSIYESTPLASQYCEKTGETKKAPDGQQSYYNAVCELKTTIPPLALLKTLKAIEESLGRPQGNTGTWGAERTIDLDVLLYDQESIDTDTLSIPHYAIKSRNFVLLPLHEANPNLVLPCGTSIKTLVKQCSQAEIQKLELGEWL